MSNHHHNNAPYRRQYFDSHYGARDWKFYRPLLAFIIEHSEPGPILDVGCGTGLFVELANRWNICCTGIDASEGAIEIARERIPHIDLFNHNIAQPFQFPDETFQAVLMNQVIEHLSASEARLCLGECWRVLRPKGILHINSPSKFNKVERDSDPTHRYLYSPDELRAVLQEVGFESVKSMDTPLRFLGTTKLGVRLASVIFHRTRWGRLSATANALARKPLPMQGRSPARPQ